MHERSIVHMDLDAFFVSVECLQHPELKGLPLLIGGKGDRGVVSACSYEARKYGIHSAMPIKTARRLCPHATVIGGDSEQYSKYSQIVTEIIAERVPTYEKSSIDEFYIDLSGMERFFGSYLLAKDIRSKVKDETDLNISFGLSINKTVSKVATNESKPNGYREVKRGTEKHFLAPLTVNKIPQVGKQTYHLLRNMGVEKVRTLQQMPVELMEDAFGKNGIMIWRKAQGIDYSPVVPYSERKSMSSERTFSQDTIDVKGLQKLLVGMTENLAFKLRSERKLTACITVKIRYSDFDTFTLQERIPYTAADHILIEKAKSLFKRLYQRRMRVRLIGVRFSHLVSGSYQIDLFEDTHEMINLYQAVDRMKERFGKQSVQRAAALGVKHREFNPFNGIRL